VNQKVQGRRYIPLRACEFQLSFNHTFEELSLDDSTQTIVDLRGRLETAERTLRTPQEDDRAEILERSLKIAQERGSELEIQLTKLKQVNRLPMLFYILA
jgi:hypothetical protein